MRIEKRSFNWIASTLWNSHPLILRYIRILFNKKLRLFYYTFILIFIYSQSVKLYFEYNSI